MLYSSILNNSFWLIKNFIVKSDVSFWYISGMLEYNTARKLLPSYCFQENSSSDTVIDILIMLLCEAKEPQCQDRKKTMFSGI